VGREERNNKKTMTEQNLSKATIFFFDVKNEKIKEGGVRPPRN
jgi:hypothetical protein